MLSLKKRHAWAGSLAFAAGASTFTFALLCSTTVLVVRHPNLVWVAGVSIVVGLLLEIVRRAKIAELRKAVDDADDRAVMRVMLNGVEIGAIPEPLFANLKLVAANDARNYFAQFASVISSVWRHTVLTLGVTAGFFTVYLAWECLVCPTDFARSILEFAASTPSHTDRVQSLATQLNAVATGVASIFAMLYMLLACVRLTFGAPIAVSGAFQADLQRRIRLILGTATSGSMSFHRARNH